MSPNAEGGGGGELQGLSKWVQLYTGAQNFADLTPNLTYGEREWRVAVLLVVQRERGLELLLTTTN